MPTTPPHHPTPPGGFNPPGSVRISAGALELARSFAKDVTSFDRAGGWIVCFSWATRTRVKDKGETEWTDLGPGLYLGAMRRTQAKPADIFRMGGLEFLVEIPDHILAQAKERLIELDQSKLDKLTLR